MGSLTDIADTIGSVSRGQQMMVEDGLPEQAVITPEERKDAWNGVKLTKPKDIKVPAKDEDPATRVLRKELAVADEKKKAERLARLKELKNQKGVATPKSGANTPAMKKPHPAEIAAEADMEAAVRKAEHFLASLFIGTGTYEKVHGDTVAAVLQEGKKLEASVGGTRRCMIYAVGQDGRATMLTAAFIDRMMRLATNPQPADAAKETTMKTKTSTAAPQKAKAKKTAAPKKVGKKAATAKARTPVGDRSRYDWKAAEEKATAGTIPPKPDFSAPTHASCLPIMEAIVAACKTADVKALKAIQINPVRSTPKAMDRYRNLCVKALTAKA